MSKKRTYRTYGTVEDQVISKAVHTHGLTEGLKKAAKMLSRTKPSVTQRFYRTTKNTKMPVQLKEKEPVQKVQAPSGDVQTVKMVLNNVEIYISFKQPV